jgi:hypothetical protein
VAVTYGFIKLSLCTGTILAVYINGAKNSVKSSSIALFGMVEAKWVREGFHLHRGVTHFQRPCSSADSARASVNCYSGLQFHFDVSRVILKLGVRAQVTWQTLNCCASRAWRCGHTTTTTTCPRRIHHMVCKWCVNWLRRSQKVVCGSLLR